MAELDLKGPLNLMGVLELLQKVTVSAVEALVEGVEGTAPPIVLPPPPASPIDAAPKTSVVLSFNQTVKAGGKPIVALGMVMQGNVPTWPGMMLPSSANTGASAVTIAQVPINVVGDQAIVFPQGGSATFSQSGQ